MGLLYLVWAFSANVSAAVRRKDNNVAEFFRTFREQMAENRWFAETDLAYADSNSLSYSL